MAVHPCPTRRSTRYPRFGMSNTTADRHGRRLRGHIGWCIQRRYTRMLDLSSFRLHPPGRPYPTMDSNHYRHFRVSNTISGKDVHWHRGHIGWCNQHPCRPLPVRKPLRFRALLPCLTIRSNRFRRSRVNSTSADRDGRRCLAHTCWCSQRQCRQRLATTLERCQEACSFQTTRSNRFRRFQLNSTSADRDGRSCLAHTDWCSQRQCARILGQTPNRVPGGVPISHHGLQPLPPFSGEQHQR